MIEVSARKRAKMTRKRAETPIKASPHADDRPETRPTAPAEATVRTSE
jgi:hypothetical protein